MGGFVLLRIGIPVGMLLLFKSSRRVEGRGKRNEENCCDKGMRNVDE